MNQNDNFQIVQEAYSLDGVIQSILEGSKNVINRRQMEHFLTLLHERCGDDLYNNIQSLINELLVRCTFDIEKNNSFEKYIEVWNDFIAKGRQLEQLLFRINKAYIGQKSEENQTDFMLFENTTKDECLTSLDYMRKGWLESVMKLDTKLAGDVLEYLNNPKNGKPMKSEGYVKIVIESYDEYLNALDQMRENWLESILKINGKLAGCVIQDSQKKNRNSPQNYEYIIAVVESFVECQMYREGYEMYEQILEKPKLIQVEKFYKELSQKLLLSKSKEDYVNICYNLLQKEKTSAHSSQKVYVKAWRRMISDRIKEITTALNSFLMHEQLDNLKVVYELLRDVPETMDVFCNRITLHEENTLTEFCKTTENSSFCENFIKIIEEKKEIIVSLYNSNSKISKAVNDARRKVLNSCLKKGNDPNAKVEVPDIIASYCDTFFKKEALGLSDDKLEKKLNGIMNIIEYIDDKDIFFKLYTKNLAKRLILSLSQSMDAEILMTKKLKKYFIIDDIAKLEKMISDSVISPEVTKKFKQTLETPLPFSFNVMILRRGLWPIEASVPSLLLPQELEKGMISFREFYKSHQTGRRLLWDHDMSTCEVKLNYLSKPYIVLTSVVVLTVLISFNIGDSITMSDLSNTTGIELQKLFKYIHFLLKEKIVLCEGVDVVEGSTISLNYKYENKKQRFKLQLQYHDQNREAERTLKSVEDDRKCYLQALIIRIMKAKKTMTHKDLVNEVIKLSISNFVPSNSMIKKMIEVLIQKEYINYRKEVYHYVA